MNTEKIKAHLAQEKAIIAAAERRELLTKGKRLNTQQALFHIIGILTKKGVEINADIHNILLENRRKPDVDSAIRKGHTKGNRSRYGYLPFYKESGDKSFYRERELNEWIIKHLIPELKRKSKAV